MAWQRLFASPSANDLSASGPDPLPRDWQAPADLFVLGVASGDPTPDGVVLWTRLAPVPLQAHGGMPDRPVDVNWVVALDERCQQVVQRGVVRTDRRKAHSVHVAVEGLASDRRYHYRFECGGVFSAIGRTRTAPQPEAMPERLRIALASCQHYEQGWFTAHRDMALSDVDLVVFVGDYIYEGPTHYRRRVRRHPIDVEAQGYSLEAYRAHHASYKLDPDLRANHAAHPWMMVWDDHEVVNDYDGQNPGDAELTPEQFLQVRASAYQAYFEHAPISPTRAPLGSQANFHALRQWGRLAHFWLLDTRQWRDGAACQDPVHSPYKGRLLWDCEPSGSAQRSMLGMAQEHWLGEGLASSRCAWRFIVQTTQMAPGRFATPVGPLQYADGWDAFPAARERLMAAIAEPRVPDVVVLGGDVHRHVAASLRRRPEDPTSPVVASEFVTSSVSSRGLSEFLNAWLRRSNPDLLHARSDQRGYALLDIDASRVRCDFRATAHPVRADSVFRTQASFVVDRGVPGPRRV